LPSDGERVIDLDAKILTVLSTGCTRDSMSKFSLSVWRRRRAHHSRGLGQELRDQQGKVRQRGQLPRPARPGNNQLLRYPDAER
jgi:hypothetical protein